MAKLQEMNALTKNGVLSAKVRNAVKAQDTGTLENALAELGYEYVAEKNAYVKTRVAQDTNIYSVLEFKVSTKHPTECAERKPKAKVVAEAIEIE